MSPATWCAAHRRSLLFLVVALVAAGTFAATVLPVGLFPHVSFPRIVVSVDAGDRPAEQMVVAVTSPLEGAVRSVPGVREIRSTTSRGSAELSVNFAWGSDMALALQQVEGAVNASLSALPAGTSFSARRMDPTVFPMAAYSLTSSTLDPVRLRDIAQYELVPLLSAIDGVASVGVLGGAQAEYRVDVDPGRLLAYDLTVDDVVKALSAANVLQAVGRLEDQYKLYLLLADTRFQSLGQIGHTIVRSGDNGLVEIEDIATVGEATVPQWLRVTADGRDAVSLQVYQQPGGNTLQIVRDVQDRLAGYRARLPPGLEIRNWYDQGELISASARSVLEAILTGAGLAALVLLVFLRSIRITLLAVFVVPAVLAATTLILYVLGMGFDIMTLGGMAAAVGLIIDDAIVMTENIFRHLRDGTGPRRARVGAAVDEFLLPLTGSSGATIIIFVPLAFLSGVSGAFFKALALTMASALVVSYLVAWLIIPLLAEHLHAAGDAGRENYGPVSRAIQRGYVAVASTALARPWLALAALGVLVAAGWFAYSRVGTGFMPPMDEGGFVLDYRAAAGTSLTETDRLLTQVEGILRSTPEVTTYSRRTGAQLGGGLTEANEGDFFIRLRPPPRRPIGTVMDDVRARIDAGVPGLDIDMLQLMEDLIGDLTAVPQPIEIKLYGDDDLALMLAAPAIAAAIAGVHGVVDVRDGITLAGDALDIRVDRARAALEGVDPEMVTRQIQAHFTGVVTTEVQSGVKLIGIRVWVPPHLRATAGSVHELSLRAPDGHHFPLDRVARVETVTGQPQIVRDNLKRMVAVTARISGRDLGSTVREVRALLDHGTLVPAGLYYELGGLYEQQQIAFRGLMIVFAAAVALVFLLLLFLYERFRIAVTIMLMPLLAMSAVFIGLWLTGTSLDITAIMGMTMVIGIVTEVAIFFFSEYRALSGAGGDTRALLVQAGISRMRPIAMTTFAAILALLPLAIGMGQGADMQRPLAIAIVAGLTVQLPLVLVAMPVVYDLLGRGSRSRFGADPGDGSAGGG